MDKILNKIESKNWINISWTSTTWTKKEILKILENKEETEKYKKNLLQSIILRFFNYDWSLWRYCWKWKQECSDWSNLYILTKEWLIKVWCGEFNSDTFINWVYSRYNKGYSERYKFKDSPLPLYVVNQYHSYLANKRTQKLMEEDPQTYLEKYTTLYYIPETKKTFSKFDENFQDTNTKINKKDIIEISDAILLFRNKIISRFDQEFTKKYMDYLQTLTVEELKTYAKDSENIKNPNEKALRNVIYKDMGCDICGSGIYSNNAIKSRYDLINSFDTNKWEFTSIPEFNIKNEE